MYWPLNAEDTTKALLSGLGPLLAIFCLILIVLLTTKKLIKLLSNLIINKSNNDIAAIHIKDKYYEDLRIWAEQVNFALTEAVHLLDSDLSKLNTNKEALSDPIHRLRITISAMIDKGRWLFPNMKAENFDYGRELAFHGHRHELLDRLVDAYNALKRIDYASIDNNIVERGIISAAKRCFVSDVQIILDPANRHREFEQILDKGRHKS